jgi:adenylate cyclase
MCGLEVATQTARYMEYNWQPEPALRGQDTGARSPALQAQDAYFLGLWDRAVTLYQEQAARHPDNGVAHYRLGVCQFYGKHYAEAVASLQKAEKLGPDQADTYGFLGRAQRAARQPADAVRNLERAIALSPRDPLTRFDLACSYAQLDQKDKALQALAQAFEAGYWRGKQVRDEEDWQALRDDPRFQEILRKHVPGGL